MTFLPEFGADKSVFHQTVGIPLIRWIHNDSMYITFDRMRITKTWSKSSVRCIDGDMERVK